MLARRQTLVVSHARNTPTSTSWGRSFSAARSAPPASAWTAWTTVPTSLSSSRELRSSAAPRDGRWPLLLHFTVAELYDSRESTSSFTTDSTARTNHHAKWSPPSSSAASTSSRPPSRCRTRRSARRVRGGVRGGAVAAVRGARAVGACSCMPAYNPSGRYLPGATAEARAGARPATAERRGGVRAYSDRALGASGGRQPEEGLVVGRRAPRPLAARVARHAALGRRAGEVPLFGTSTPPAATRRRRTSTRSRSGRRAATGRCGYSRTRPPRRTSRSASSSPTRCAQLGAIRRAISAQLGARRRNSAADSAQFCRAILRRPAHPSPPAGAHPVDLVRDLRPAAAAAGAAVPAAAAADLVRRRAVRGDRARAGRRLAAARHLPRPRRLRRAVGRGGFPVLSTGAASPRGS